MKKKPDTSNKSIKLSPGPIVQSRQGFIPEAFPQTEENLYRLVHELQVHQIELKLQNEELRQARDEVEAGLERYTDLYDFAPVGYFTLAYDGTIRQANLSGARVLGVERAQLVGRQFSSFVVDNVMPGFNDYLKNIFKSDVKETMEVAVLSSDNKPLWIKIEAIAMPDGKTCRVAVMDITERKHIESQKDAVTLVLRESETRYRILADSIDEIFFALDDNLKLTFWNKASEELTGILKGTAIGKSIYEVFSDNPETRQTAMMCLEALQTQHSRTFIQQNKIAGRDYCFEINIYPSEGELSVMMKDINTRKQEEVALLLESEARFRAIANYTYDWENWMGPDGTLLWVNPAVERITGYSPEEFILMPGLFEAVILEADKEKIHRHIINGLKNGQSYNNLEYRIRRKDDSIIWVTISYQPIYSVKGDNIGLRSSIRNIDDQKRLQADIIREHDFYLTLFENFPALIWRAGTDTKCNYFNQAWLEFTGRSLEKELGDGWLVGIHPGDYLQYHKVFIDAFKDRLPFEIEYRLRSANGQYHWILDIAKPYYDLSGEFSGYIGSCYDITERKTSEETIKKQITTHQRDLSVLYQVATITSELKDKNCLLEKMLDILLEAIHCRAAAVHLFNQDNALTLETSIGLSSESSAFLQRLPPAWVVSNRVKKPYDPILIKNIPDNLYFDDSETTGENQHQSVSARLQPDSPVSYLGLPILVRDEPIGVVSLFTTSENEFTTDAIALGNAAARHIGLALKNIDLIQLESKQTIENERAKLARDLHDSITQSLYSLMLFSTAAQDAGKKSNMEKLDTCLTRIIEQSMLANKHLRLLLYELNLDFFEQEGLVNAINYRLDVVERRLGIDVQMHADVVTPIPEALELNLFYFINEALTNALKHAQASYIHIQIQSNNDYVAVEISDNGKGFILDAVAKKGMGLKSMRERAANMGGNLIISSEIEKGTKVGIKVRCGDD